MGSLLGEKDKPDVAETTIVQKARVSLCRLEGLDFKVKEPAIFSSIALAMVSLTSYFFLAEHMRNLRICHRHGERAALLPRDFSSEMALSLQELEGGQCLPQLYPREGHLSRSRVDPSASLL